MSLTNDLRHRVTVYTKQQQTTALGDMDFGYAPFAAIWAGIVPKTGKTEEIAGEQKRAAVTHVVTIRANALPDLNVDMYLMSRGQRYDVEYWQPHYKRPDRVQLMCRLVVEM